MKRKRYTDEQIAFAPRQAESGTAVEEICRKLGVSEPTFYRWKKQFAGMGVVEIRRLKQLEEENAKLKRLVAELFDGQCPCRRGEPVLTEGNRPVPGAEFDHFFHRGLNRPEHGWLVCAACHAELSHGGYLVRFMRIPEFRAFQGAVLEYRRRERARFGSPTE
jgi:hypothetical protein